MHILLYTLIPSRLEHEPVGRAFPEKIRNRAARAIDFVRWIGDRRWRGNYSTHEDNFYSNQGDIAVRISTRKQLHAAFAPGIPTIEEVPWGELDGSRPADLVVLSGGGFFFPNGAGYLPQRFADEVAAIERFRCPVIGASLGLNADLNALPAPYFHPSQRDLLRRFVRGLSLLSVRDRITQAALSPYVDAPDIVADPALFLRDDASAPAHPLPFRLPNEKRPLTVGLNLAFHGHEVSQLQERTLPTFVQSLKALTKRHRCRFVYFAHSSGEYAMAQALRLAGIPCDFVSGPVPNLQSGYAQVDIVIAQMLHASILAWAQGTPALGLAYDVKSFGFFDLIGRPDLCLNMWTAQSNEIVDAVERIIASRDDLRHSVRSRVDRLRDDSISFYEGVALSAQGAEMREPRIHAVG